MATVTQDAVYAAAEALEARGQRVSVRTIRDHLGGGSPNQITPLLSAWRAKKPQVAQADIQLDPRIGQLIAEQVKPGCYAKHVAKRFGLRPFLPGQPAVSPSRVGRAGEGCGASIGLGR